MNGVKGKEMKRDIDFKCIVYEIKNNIKKILIICICSALVFLLYGLHSFNQKIDNINYCSYGYIGIGDDFGIISRDKNDNSVVDFTKYNIMLIESDANIEKTLIELEKQGINMSNESLREMIFVQGETKGKVLKINILSDNQKKSNSICKAILVVSKTTLENEYEIVNIEQMPVDQGAVSVQNWVSESDPMDTKYIISGENIDNGILGYAFKGIVFGIIIAILYIVIQFIRKDNIVYKEQFNCIDNINIVEYIDGKSELIEKKVISELLLQLSKQNVICIVALNNVTDLMISLRDRLIASIKALYGNVALIDCCGVDDKSKPTHFNDMPNESLIDDDSPSDKKIILFIDNIDYNTKYIPYVKLMKNITLFATRDLTTEKQIINIQNKLCALECRIKNAVLFDVKED